MDDETTDRQPPTSPSAFAESPAFVARVRAALVRAALDVAAEDPGEGAAAWERAGLRHAFAMSVLHGQEREARSVAYAVATTPSIAQSGQAATDNDIAFAVNSVFDAFAGVRQRAPATPVDQPLVSPEVTEALALALDDDATTEARAAMRDRLRGEDDTRIERLEGRR